MMVMRMKPVHLRRRRGSECNVSLVIIISGDTMDIIINTGQRRKQHHLHKLLIVVQRLPLMEKTNPKGDISMMSLYHMTCI